MERTWAKLTDELIEKALSEDLGNGDVTTDAVVTSMDRVLLIQRGGKQGHGQWALPILLLENQTAPA